MARGLCRKPSNLEEVSKMMRLMLLGGSQHTDVVSEFQANDLQIQAHTNGIAGNEEVVIVVRVVE